jgi:enoyl-CoA hydratase/carnithine racemase
VATITLNRPDKLNAWTAVMESEVRAAMENAERDDEVRVIVLTGAGRGFCAGVDMSLLSAVAEHGLDDQGREQASRGEGQRHQGVSPDFQKKYSYFPAIAKPVIAAINGPAVGLGLPWLPARNDAAASGSLLPARQLLLIRPSKCLSVT